MVGLRVFRVGALAMACGAGCLPELPEPNREPASACGSEGQPCCVDGASCAEGLVCDAPAGQCVLDERRYCTSEAQCRPSQTCCISGLIGRCFDVEAGASCPIADLEVEMDATTLALSYESHVFDPELDPVAACALEKGCIGGVGERQLLHFSTAVRNSGDADLLFGLSSEAPHVVAACDGQPYFPHFLDYQLVDSGGEAVARGAMQARCEPSASAFASGFDCSFDALRAKWSRPYPARSVGSPFVAGGEPAPDEQPSPNPSQNACQWIDITGVPAGSYILRVQVNEQSVLTEARTYNNRVDVEIRIPRFDDPSQPCPSAEEGGELLGSGPGRECGWTPALSPRACTPGTAISVNCAACRDDASLRICEGTEPCSFTSAVSVSSCPGLDFICPPSGSLSVYSSSPLPVTSGAACILQRSSASLQ